VHPVSQVKAQTTIPYEAGLVLVGKIASKGARAIGTLEKAVVIRLHDSRPTYHSNLKST